MMMMMMMAWKMSVRLLRKSLCFNTRVFSMWLWCRANGFEINFLFALHGGWMSFCSCRIMADNLASHWTNVERLMKFVHCMCIARCCIAVRPRYLVVHNQNIKQAWHYNQTFFLDPVHVFDCFCPSTRSLTFMSIHLRAFPTSPTSSLKEMRPQSDPW